jgi:hypothetical protein
MSHNGFKCINCGYFTAEWGVAVCPKCGYCILDDLMDKPAKMPDGEQYNKDK